MASFAKLQQRLKSFDFTGLFTQELLWNNFRDRDLDIPVDGKHYTLSPVAEQSGMAVYVCTPAAAPDFPDYPTRRKIDTRVTKIVREHIVIYLDPAKQFQIWQWVKREAGKASACREQRFEVHQTGDALIQKLIQITFSLEDEPTIGETREKVKKAFDLEKVTKKFYDEFKKQHAAFLKFLKGIPDEHLQRWYASVMLNRLMFIYFVQKKGFLNGNLDYLKHKLAESKKRDKNEFYSDFLCPLFFEGFAKRESDRSAKTKQLLGNIPYLNGGLFLKHQIEHAHGESIEIADTAFEKIFAFFDQYQWHLDDRPTREGNEINPDVLGYVFEKYINQKEMGAYYTKEDITGYISQNTIIPAVFDAARKGCKVAFEGEHSIWSLLKEEPDRYFYAAVLHGTGKELPKEIAAGIKDVAKRGDWNKTAPEEYGLPTETWREVVARRQLYEEVRAKLAAGEVKCINDLITYNLDIQRFAEEVISNSEGSELVWAFYKAVEKLSVLDPTCGSGAFLFAALNILEKLYDTCLVRMQAFVDDLDRSGQKHSPKKFENFRLILAEMNDKSRHPSPRYFILKSIILNNLYGVDIMEEATEICKLRLFLKLVAQVNAGDRIEPLPDIDFNIRSGNSLVGFANAAELEEALGRLGHEERKGEIEIRAEQARRAYDRFRDLQVIGSAAASDDTARSKDEVHRRFSELRSELDDYLSGEYNIKKGDRKGLFQWRYTHTPFHWFAEFYGIIAGGGFDVIIGNPPWREYSASKKDYSVRGFETERCGNLYALCIERSLRIRSKNGCFSFIVQLPLATSSRMQLAREILKNQSGTLFTATFDDRPGKLFDGLEHCRAVIFNSIGSPSTNVCRPFTTRYHRWSSAFREYVFSLINYTCVAKTLRPGLFAKHSSSQEEQVFERLATDGLQPLGFALSKHVTEHFIFYQEATGYWVKAVVGLPFYSCNGKTGAPPHGRYLYFSDRQTSAAACAVLNSSLFYNYFVAFGDCFHLSDTLVSSFPLPKTVLGDRRLSQLGSALMKELTANAERKNIRTKDGTRIQYAEYYGWKSKSLIDEVDAFLGEHFKMTAEEIDHVVNFDIKFRTSQEGESDEQSAEASAC
jgi:hypothetical protein